MKKKIKKYLIKFIGIRLNIIYSYAPDRAAQKALKLFMTPHKGRITPEKHHLLKEAETASISVLGKAIQTYVWPGGGQKIVLVHGWESNVTRWQELINLLRDENFTVIGLDAPAHGNSEGATFDVPHYGEAIQQVVEKYHPQFIMGHSIGAASVLFQHYKCGLTGVEKMLLLAPPSEMRNIMADFQHQLNLKTALIQVFEKHFRTKFGYDFADFSMLKFTRNFGNKALFIHDKEDKIVNWEESAAIVKQWKNAELLVTDGLGHGLKSNAVYAAIIRYLTT